MRLGGGALGAGRLSEHAPEVRCAPPREPELGHDRHLEEDHVPALGELSRVRGEGDLHQHRMRARNHHRALHQLRMLTGQQPGDGATPVVADDPHRHAAHLSAQAGDVSHQAVEIVPTARPGALAVAPEIRRDHAEAGGDQGAHLQIPRAVGLRKPVQQYHGWTAACLHVVQADAVHLGEVMDQLHALEPRAVTALGAR